MKKIMLSISMCFLLSCFAHAQLSFEAPGQKKRSKISIDDFMGGGTFLYAKPVGGFSDYAKGGIGYSGVLGYNLDENLTVGIEYSSAATLSIGGPSLVDLYGLNSFLAKGWYKIGTKKVKPFVGLGLGLASFEEPTITITTTDIDGKTNETTIVGEKRAGFGANAEVGVSIVGVILSYSFNLGGKTAKEPVFNEAAADLGISYHRLSAGYIYNF